MQVHVTRDSSVAHDIALSMFVESNLNDVLERFAKRVTRVEVFLSGAIPESDDVFNKCCQMEARLFDAHPLLVSEAAVNLETAVRGATHKLLHLLTRQFGRLGDSG